MTFRNLLAGLMLIQGAYLTTAAQDNSIEQVLMNPSDHQLIQYIKVNPKEAIPVVNEGRDWLHEVLKLSEKDHFNLLSMESDKLGFTHYRLQQTHADKPVIGSMYIIHAKDGRIVSANGEYAVVFEKNEFPTVTAQEAISIALNHTSAQVYKWELPQEEIALKQVTGNSSATYYPQPALVYQCKPEDKKKAYSLCYKMDVYAQYPLSREYVYVNASNGEIWSTESRICRIDSLGSGDAQYSGNVAITTDFSGGQFKLSESGRGSGIVTLNMHNGTNYGAATDFTHPDNIWDSLGADILAVDAHFGAEATYDYLMHVQGRNSLDNNGFALYSYVHYDNNFANAFWDGQQMTYGDGDGTISPLVSVEICGHEIGHGLQQFTAQFTQFGESGAMGESFSDIMGSLVEAYKFPGRSDSLIYNTGDQVIGNAVGLRNYIDPGLTSNPDTYLGQNWDVSNFDVHGNGVVHDHWFYILSEGKSGVNDNNDAYNVTGIGMDKAGDIAYRSLTVYMTPNAGYQEARRYAIFAAQDLYGPCANEVIQTTNAWYAVGVGDAYSTVLDVDFTYTLDICASPKTVQFSNSSSAAALFHWDFGDGATSSLPNPAHTYADGTFSVKLVATACDLIAKDSLTLNTLIIDNSIICDSVNMPGSGNASSQNCYGVLYDNGGKNGDVVPNIHGIYTISPSNATQVSVTFLKYDYLGFFDQVDIYDGPSVTSPLLASYNFFSIPDNTPITSTGGSITIEENTASSFPGFPQGAGFELQWTCETSIGLDHFSSSEPAVYPNPTNGMIFIRNLDDSRTQILELMNMMGEKLLTKVVAPNSGNRIELNLETLNTDGVYFLSIISGDERVVKKIVFNR